MALPNFQFNLVRSFLLSVLLRKDANSAGSDCLEREGRDMFVDPFSVPLFTLLADWIWAFDLPSTKCAFCIRDQQLHGYERANCVRVWPYLQTRPANQ